VTDFGDLWIIMLCYTMLAVNVYLAVKTAKRQDMSIYLRFAICFTVFFWNFPLIARPIVAWASPTNSFMIDHDTFFEADLLELSATAVVLQCYLWANGGPSRILQYGPVQIKIGTDFLPTSIAFLCVTVCAILAPTLMVDYLTINAAPMQLSPPDQSESFQAETVVGSICIFAILATSSSLSTGLGTFLFRSSGWMVIILFAIVRLFSGSRASVLLPAVVYVINQFLLCQSRKWRHATAVFLLLCVTAPFTIIAMGSVRSIPGYSQQEISSALEAVGQLNLVDSTLNVLIGFHNKADSISTSAILLEREGPGMGGIQPVASSLFALIPRAVWPTKPVPGSRDGTMGGLPTRLGGMYLGGGDSLWVGLSPCHVSIWQSGYLIGVIFFVIANVIYLKILNRLLLSDSFWLRGIALYSMVPPLFHQTITSPDLVVQGLTRLCLFLAPFALWSLVIRRTRPRDLRSLATAGR
jgi:hypothetical protein